MTIEELTSLTSPACIRADADGVLRIGKTRVTLDTVITAFNLGATPEEIVQQFPSLTVENVYSCISTYLHHKNELDPYLDLRHQRAQEKLEEIAPGLQGIQQRLLNRQLQPRS